MEFEDAPPIAEQAFAALHAGELEEAQRLCLKLRELRYSAFFEIQALIFLGQNELERAIEVLREGVEVAPSVWLLWQLLGNSLSDNSQFEEALQCYERALQLDLEDDDRASISFNQATVLGRAGRNLEALERLDSINGDALEEQPLLQVNVELLRLQLWATSNRCDDVGVRSKTVEALLRDLKRDANDDFQAVCELWSRGAQTLLQCGFTARARAWATESLDVFIANPKALEILRLTQPNAPLAKRYFQVLLQGEAEAADGFYISYSVVARDANEAQSLAMAMEAPRQAKPLTVSECNLLGKCDQTPVGVYEVGGYCFFPLDGPEE